MDASAASDCHSSALAHLMMDSSASLISAARDQCQEKLLVFVSVSAFVTGRHGGCSSPTNPERPIIRLILDVTVARVRLEKATAISLRVGHYEKRPPSQFARSTSA